MSEPKATPNMIGSYGPWAAASAANWERSLSYLNPRWENIDQWRETARTKVIELLAGPQISSEIYTGARLRRQYSYDDLDIEELSWQLPYGPETQAVFLKPRGSNQPLPGVLGLHDHAAVKYFGKSKILRTSPKIHPYIEEHQNLYYDGIAWANALARRGYGVLVHDVFPFESRKIAASELPGHVVKRMMTVPGEAEELRPDDLQKPYRVHEYDVDKREHTDQIETYHAFAAQHEDIIAKSLLSAGFTWAGVFAAEDRTALEILCNRPDIDDRQIGCCGLSLGGLRSNYLAGLDDRIRCSVTVGFMTTWRDLVLHNCYTHTWMVYIPILCRYMDFPEILGLRAPLPAMVLATDADPLFSGEEVQGALQILERVYAKAGSAGNFTSAIHPGPHQFNSAMQNQAFEWLDRHLRKRD